ncbi:nodulation protein NodH [Phaeovulum vinaykumarii]|uniref:LPS sulfotransferase NodH n=1 Tax=Phaeovulum vinaykumarii TaxID=407234 RepID=A0A1N7KRN4_9RHOB|nr:nodulation protein NodH [Phaeovulum vinaykumarii]SIS64090.1 hypothetical protein SAMN05421795_10276 [Phaeovulum vinaykumarii]SOC01681.1 hypothetical protein SAMN05878426_102698 [Phaeovulum vinaykumarii]
MTRPFDSFVVFAEMRTGSNLFEACLNALPGVHSYGEAFNPTHLGDPDLTQLLGVSLGQRLSDPALLLTRIREAEGLTGFRYFHDHDPRIFDVVMNDPRCAKIVLTRNPVECYVSLKIAYNTDRWRLTHVRDRREFKSPFKPAEFEKFLAPLQTFQVKLMNALQKSGQTAFYIDYEDLRDLDVLAGLAKWLGVEGRLEALPTGLIKQNPEEMSKKVRNFDEMERALARIDWANLSRTPNFEPRRGPAVPGFIAGAGGAAGAGLLYMPVRPGPEAGVRAWLEAAEETACDFTQKELRKWKRTHPGHRSFTIVRHPLDRAWTAFSQVLAPGHYPEIRALLNDEYDLGLPEPEALGQMSPGDWHRSFLAFLKFAKANIGGQTPVRVDPVWASQTAVIQGFGDFALPDMICREDRLAEDLAALAAATGARAPDTPPVTPDPGPVTLAQIADADLERAVRDAYPRDFMTFGFGSWAASAP